MAHARRLASERVVSFAALAILLLGIGASLLAASTWRSYVRESSARAFSSTATAADAALASALQRDVELTSTARTLVQTMPGLTNSRLTRWFDTLGFDNNFPGSFGLLYIEAVPRAGVGAFSRLALADPPFGLHLIDHFAVPPARGASPYCFTRFGVAADLPDGMSLVNASLGKLVSFTAPDINYCSLTIGSLLERARSSGRTEVASLSSLLKTTGQAAPASGSLPAFLAQAGLVASVTPVYRGAGPAAGESRQPIEGWVLGMFEADEILDPLVKQHESLTLSFKNPLGSTVVLDRAGNTSGPRLARTFRLDVDGTWLATFTAPVVVSGLSANYQFLVVLFAGVALSVLLFALVRVLAGSRAQALKLAEARTGELRHQALHDTLTTLPNRALIFDRTEQTLVRARHDGHFVAVLYCDLDGFKDVNDTYGHVIGDELLREVGARFRAVVPDMNTVGRLGGDEFVALIEDADRSDAQFLATRLLEEMRAPFELGPGGSVHLAVTTSIGIALGNTTSAEELLREADIALYEAKANGKNRSVVFETAMHDALQNRLMLEFDLRTALAKEEFFLQYQPIFDLDTMRVRNVEALLRWRHPSRDVIGPTEFIPLLESSGAIVEVGRFVLEEACRQVARWNAAGHDLHASVNVSARQLESHGLVDHVVGALEHSGLEPGALVLEITETALMSDTERALVELQALKTIGIQIAIDDFGTGYSSLAYLERFPVDSIKIDQSFVAGMDSSREGRTLVHTLVQLGKALGLTTLAEGIEETRQLERLRAENCDVGQGFLFARPLDPGELLALLERSRGPEHLIRSA